jgi:hypothetical protein
MGGNLPFEFAASLAQDFFRTKLFRNKLFRKDTQKISAIGRIGDGPAASKRAFDLHRRLEIPAAAPISLQPAPRA